MPPLGYAGVIVAADGFDCEANVVEGTDRPVSVAVQVGVLVVSTAVGNWIRCPAAGTVANAMKAASTTCGIFRLVATAGSRFRPFHDREKNNPFRG